VDTNVKLQKAMKGMFDEDEAYEAALDDFSLDTKNGAIGTFVFVVVVGVYW